MRGSRLGREAATVHGTAQVLPSADRGEDAACRLEFNIFGHVSIDDVTQPDWDIPRPVATCRHLLEAARLHRIDASDCFAGTGVTPADIDDTATEVQAGQELAILRNILARVKDPHEFARDVGLQYNFANTGVFGYALLARVRPWATRSTSLAGTQRCRRRFCG